MIWIFSLWWWNSSVKFRCSLVYFSIIFKSLKITMVNQPTLSFWRWWPLQTLSTLSWTETETTTRRSTSTVTFEICSRFPTRYLTQPSYWRFPFSGMKALEFFHNSRLIRRIQQNKIYKKFRDLTRGVLVLLFFCKNNLSFTFCGVCPR